MNSELKKMNKKFPREVKCVIFDMDGVIIDTEPLHRKAYFNTFKSLKIKVTEELYTSFTGSSTINAFERIVKHFNLSNIPADLVAQKRAFYVDLFENDPTLRLIEGVLESIQYFHQKGITLVLASSSAKININRVFKRFDLDKYFVAKISGADLKDSKPHPEIFEKAAILGKTPKENCIVIEDSDNGITAANKAKIFAVGYVSEHSALQTLKGADLVINNFSELEQWI